jgi:hypothetical protein
MEHVRDPESGFNVYGSGYTADDRAISRVMMNYVANFVRSGDPTKPRPRSAESSIEDRFYGTPWPQYSQATREAYMEIGGTFLLFVEVSGGKTIFFKF